MGPILRPERRTGQRNGKRRRIRRSMICIVFQNSAPVLESWAENEDCVKVNQIDMQLMHFSISDALLQQ